MCPEITFACRFLLALCSAVDFDECIVIRSWSCHRNFGPGNFGPGDQNFQWKIGPAGPIFSGKMVRLWKIGPNNGPSISALVTSDCCG